MNNPSRRLLQAFVLGAALVTGLGCATLDISVYQYGGDLGRSYRARLSEARGKANQALAKIQSDPALKAYIVALATKGVGQNPPPKLPDEYLKRINRVLDDTNKTSPGGLPKLKNKPPYDESDTDKRTRYEFNESVKSKLNIVEKELLEFSAFIRNFDPDDILPSNDDSADRNRLSQTVDELRTLGEEIAAHVEFPDFSDVIADSGAWKLINPVRTFGGFGKTEFIVYKDETGNYQLKSAVFDPSDVAQAARKSVAKVLTTVAAAYGFPIPTAGGDGKAQPTTIPSLKLETQKAKDQVELLKWQNGLFKERLDKAKAAIPNTFADEAARIAAVDALLRELAAYETSAKSLTK
jgi:hypothetical protein